MYESDYAVSETVPKHQNANVYLLCTCQQSAVARSLLANTAAVNTSLCVWHVDGTPATSKLQPDVEAEGWVARGDPQWEALTRFSSIIQT